MMKYAGNTAVGFIFLSLFALPAFAQSYDGEWQVSETVNATACGEGTYVDSYTATVSQCDNTMTVSANGISSSGPLNGATLTFSVTFQEDGGTNTGYGTINFNGNSATGSSSWSWTNGSLTCNGTTSISATRLSQPAPEPEPEPAETPVLPGVPVMSFDTSDNTLTVNWTAVADATGYLFYYAPYPSADPVLAIDVGLALSIAGDLPTGAAFYLALQSYNAAGEGGISNVGNFLMKGVDVIEIANQDSDIAAIVYGSENASAVLFNDSSTTSTVQFRIGDNQTATLVSDSQGNPMQFDIGGHSFAYTYGGSQVRTTLAQCPLQEMVVPWRVEKRG